MVVRAVRVRRPRVKSKTLDGIAVTSLYFPLINDETPPVSPPDLSTRPFQLVTERTSPLSAHTLDRAWTEGLDRRFAARNGYTPSPCRMRGRGLDGTSVQYCEPGPPKRPPLDRHPGVGEGQRVVVGPPRGRSGDSLHRPPAWGRQLPQDGRSVRLGRFTPWVEANRSKCREEYPLILL